MRQKTFENLAFQGKAKKNLFIDLERAIKIKLDDILEKLKQPRNRRGHARFYMSQDDCDSEICESTQFSQIRKTQLIDIQEALERYCNVLPVFGFNSAQNVLNSIKSFFPSILVNDRDIEPNVNKKLKNFIPFELGDENVCQRRENKVSTSENVDIMLHNTKRITD